MAEDFELGKGYFLSLGPPLGGRIDERAVRPVPAGGGVSHQNGQVVAISNPNDANALGIGMVHQHFKLVECFTVLDNIILGVEPCRKWAFCRKPEAREKVLALSEKYGLQVDPDALVEDVTVGMQQRAEILKMLYRDNEILIFDEPTAVLTPQEIDELMEIMKNLAAEGKSILFISHKLNEIMAVADRCTVLRKGKYIGTVNIAETTSEELSRMMVGRDVEFAGPQGALQAQGSHPGGGGHDRGLQAPQQQCCEEYLLYGPGGRDRLHCRH